MLWSGGWTEDCPQCDTLGTKQEVSQGVALDIWDCFPSLHSYALVVSWVPAWHFISATAGVPCELGEGNAVLHGKQFHLFVSVLLWHLLFVKI